MLHLVGYLYYWQIGFNSVFKGLICQENPNLVKIGKRLSCTLHEDLNSICYFPRRNFATNTLLCNILHFYIVNRTCSSRTHKKNVAFSLQLWIRERSTTRRYTIIAYLVARVFSGLGEACSGAHPDSWAERAKIWTSKLIWVFHDECFKWNKTGDVST